MSKKITLQHLAQEVRDLAREPLRCDPSQPPVTVRGEPIRFYLSRLADRIDELASSACNPTSKNDDGKPFYVDVGTSIVAIRCASNRDVVVQYDYAWSKGTLKLARDICDRMNEEVEIGRPLRNCDVGTADEQHARFCVWCRKHGINGDNEVDCIHPDVYCDLCALRWSQMPCKDGEIR